MANTGSLRFQAPDGKIVERPQEEFQSLRRAGFKPLSGQTVSAMGSSGIRELPVESLMTVSPTEELPIERQSLRFSRTASERYGTPTGMLKAFGAGAAQGFTSGFGEGAAIEAGLTTAENVRMMREGAPIASTLGEVVGGVGQALAATALTGPVGGVEAGAASLGRAAAARQAAARGLAYGVPYGVGSEFTESRVEGREADYLRGAATGAAGGLVGEAVGGALAKAYPKVKGFISGFTDKGAAAERAVTEAEKALKAAVEKEAAEKSAAATAARNKAEETLATRRQALFDLRQAEKAAKTAGVAAVEDADIAAGKDASKKISDKEAEFKTAVEAAQVRARDYLAKSQELGETLASRGLPKDAATAQAKLANRMMKNATNIANLSSDIASTESLAANMDRLISEATDMGQIARDAAIQKARAQASLKTLNAEMRALAGGAADAKAAAAVSSKIEEQTLAFEMAQALENHARVQLDNYGTALGAHEAQGIIAAGKREVDEELKATLKTANKLRSQIQAETADKAIIAANNEMVAGAEEAAKVVATASNTVKDFAPTTAMNRIRSGRVRKTLFQADKESWSALFEEAASQGKLAQVVRAALGDEGILVGEKAFGATGMTVAEVLRDSKRIIGMLTPQERAVLSRTLGKMNITSKNATYVSKLRDALSAAIKSPEKGGYPLVERGAVTPVAAAAAEPATEASLAQVAFNARTPEATSALASDLAATERNAATLKAEMATLDSFENEMKRRYKFAQQTVRKERAAERLTRLGTQGEKASLRAAQAAVVQDQMAATMPQIAQLREEAASLMSKIGTEGVDQKFFADEVRSLRQKMAEVQKSSGYARRIEKATGQIAASERELASDAATMSAIDNMRAALDAARDLHIADRAKMPGLVKSAPDVGQFVATSEEVIQKEMAKFFKTEDGRKLAEAVARSEKAAVAKTAREAAEAASGPVKQQALDAARSALGNPVVWAAAATGGPVAGMTAMAGFMASKMPSLSLKKLAVAMAPQMFVSVASGAAKILMERTLAKDVSRRITTTKMLNEISREDVEKTKSDVDALIEQQELARNAFKRASGEVLFPQDSYREMESRFMGAVSKLQQMRPETYGKGPITAEEEDFVKAYRVITDPDSLVRAMERGGDLSNGQIQMLKQVSPEAHQAIQDVLTSIRDNAPKPVATPLSARMGVSMTVRGKGMSIGDAQKLVGLSDQSQQGGQGLGTRRPGTTSSLAENASFSTRVGGGRQ
jgi:hypothetical protein